MTDLGLVYLARQPSYVGPADPTEGPMEKFMLLHYGFEQPTPEIMKAWGDWFESIADRMVEQGGFSAAREVSSAGVADLPMGMESITG